MNSEDQERLKNPDEETFRKKGKAPVKYPSSDAGGKTGRTPLRVHTNPIVRFFAKAGFTVWMIVMVVGLVIAFTVALFLV